MNIPFSQPADETAGLDPANPYHAVYLPEFGFAVSWLACRNPMCPNFGVHYAGPGDVGGRRRFSDGRYRLTHGGLRLNCVECGHSFYVHSNRSIRPMARHFLSQSLPFADCPDPGCVNHGINVFENYWTSPPFKGRAYRRDGPERARCTACGSSVNLGESLRLHGGAKSRKGRDRLGWIIELGTGRLPVVRTRSALGMSVASYYAHLRSAGARLRDYQAWRCAGLLRKCHGERKGPLLVYSDSFEAVFRRGGVDARSQAMPIPVTVVELPDSQTTFILAAHPGFLPDAVVPRDPWDLSRDASKSRHEADWDCVQHSYNYGAGHASEKRPALGVGGFYAVAPYMYLAHFLVVRKMLSRFPLVHFYMDADRTQRTAALTAFAEPIRAGRWEVVQYKRNAKRREDTENIGRWPKDPAKRRKALDGALDKAWKALEARWAEKRGAGTADHKLFAKALAAGVDHPSAGWAWLEYPPAGARYKGGRSHWLTRRAGMALGPELRDILRLSSTLPVDRIHNALRNDARGLARPGNRVEPGQSYLDSLELPLVASAELWIAMVRRNFGVRLRQSGKPPRALAMGIVGARERPCNLLETAISFRLDLSHAERMSGWVRG